MNELMLMITAQRYDLSDPASRHKSSLDLAELFKYLVIHTKPDRFLEVGSFDAAFSRLCKKNLSNCIFDAYEANPYNYENFRLQVNADSVNYIHQAIGDYDGEVTFKVQKNIGDQPISKVIGNNSILSRNQDDVVYEDVVVNINKIDTLYGSKLKKDDRLAMWVDVEGFAFHVFLGAASVLNQTDLILVEVEDYPFWEDQKLSSDIIKHLSNIGFLPVARDFEYNTQYNIVFMRAEAMQNFLVKFCLSNFYSGTGIYV